MAIISFIGSSDDTELYVSSPHFFEMNYDKCSKLLSHMLIIFLQEIHQFQILLRKLSKHQRWILVKNLYCQINDLAYAGHQGCEDCLSA